MSAQEYSPTPPVASPAVAPAAGKERPPGADRRPTRPFFARGHLMKLRSTAVAPAKKLPAVATRPEKTKKKPQRPEKTNKTPRRKNPARLTPKRCRTIFAALEAFHEARGPLREPLARLRRLLRRKNLDTEAVLPLLREAARGVRTLLAARAREAQARVEGADREREARTASQSEAQTHLAALKHAIAGKREAIRSSLREQKARAKEVAGARAALAGARAEVKKLAGRKRQLELVAEESYGPLKEAPATGSEGQKRLRVLRKVGKEFGFHGELITILPAVLKKQLDKRRTFDGVALRQMELEFAKHTEALGANIEEGEASMAQISSSMQAAQQELLIAQAERAKSERAITDFEAALTAGKGALQAARKHLRELPQDLKRAGQELARARARLERFTRGPAAAIGGEEEEEPAPPPAYSGVARAEAHVGRKEQGGPVLFQPLVAEREDPDAVVDDTPSMCSDR